MFKKIIAVLTVLILPLFFAVLVFCPEDAQVEKSTYYEKTVESTKPAEIIKHAETIRSTETIRPTETPDPVKPTGTPVIKPVEIEGLIELAKLDNTFVFDIKYATTDNFTGKKIYSQSKCLINKNTAVKLIKANEEFKKKGYRIKIFDAYRPYSAQKVLWDAASDKSFVADPKKGSVHNRGAAVDITLVDKNGVELQMPSGYDEFTERARLDYKDCTEDKIANRELLGKTMVKYGFRRISNEWWHFEDTDAQKYEIKDIPFERFQ